MSQRQSIRSHALPSGTRERRSVCRYSVVQDNAWIGWWEGQTYQTTAAKIIDISLRGALLHVDTLPPRDQAIWFCPPGITTNEEWIEVKTINLRKKLFGAREIRVAFRKVFPYELFKAVVYGPDAMRTVQPTTWLPDDAPDRDWW
jgi:hypothetical protein